MSWPLGTHTPLTRTLTLTPLIHHPTSLPHNTSRLTQNFLERRYNDDMELDDAVHIALLTMRESYEGEMTKVYIYVVYMYTHVHVRVCPMPFPCQSDLCRYRCMSRCIAALLIPHSHSHSAHSYHL